MSTSALPTVAAASGPPGVLASAERVQQLQTLIAQVEHRTTGATFASALDSAQSRAAGSAVAAGAYSDPAPTYTTATPAAGGYASAVLPGGGYTSTGPTAVAYPSAAPNPSGASAVGEGSAYAPLIDQAAARYGLDPAILHGLIQQESGFDPSAHSSAGALGLTQLMPSTAASLGVAEPLDPAQSIEGGARYLSQLLHQFAGNTADALAAYNAGPGAVQQYGGVPPYSETQQYVAKVLGYAASYGTSTGATPSGAIA